MKKTVLVLAVLMLAVPVMAGARIDANQVGTTNVVEVKYTATDGNIPRAFAIDVRVSAEPNHDALAPYDFNPNFYVAPGTFTYIGGVTVWGNPAVGPNTVGFTTEMGSLYATNDPCGHIAQPPTTGVLFRFKVDHSCHVDLLENAQRGGVVMESTSVTFPPGYVTLYDCNVSLLQPPPVPAHILYPPYDPDCNIPVWWAASSGATSYELSRSDNNGLDGYPTTYTVTDTNKMTTVLVGLHKYRVRAYNIAGFSDYRTGAAECNSTLSTCYRGGNTADPNWASWIALGRPDCWCGTPKGSIYQCDGDSDGAKYGSWRIYTGDLGLLTKNWKTTAALMAKDPNMTGTTLKIVSACADTDHKAYGSFRVYTADLTKLTSQWKAPDTNFPGNCPR